MISPTMKPLSWGFKVISFKDYLNETVLNIGLSDSDRDLRTKHEAHISDILKSSYKSVGGYGGLGSGSSEEHSAITADIHNPNHFIKGTVRDGKLVAVSLYRKTDAGRKRIASGTDGSTDGKKGYIKSQEEDRDRKERNAYSEVSHKPEEIAKKMGVPQVSNDDVSKIIGKPIEKLPNGTHYQRDLGGVKRTKVMVGHPDLKLSHKFH